MATISISIRRHNQKINGLYPVYYRLIHKRETKYINTGTTVTSAQLDEDLNITDNWVMHDLTGQIMLYEQDISSKLGLKINTMTCSQLKDWLITYNKFDQGIDFIAFARPYLADKDGVLGPSPSWVTKSL